ncbi:unnamed protein product, partial [Chrysoparadoxa australica]
LISQLHGPLPLPALPQAAIKVLHATTLGPQPGCTDLIKQLKRLDGTPRPTCCIHHAGVGEDVRLQPSEAHLLHQLQALVPLPCPATCPNQAVVGRNQRAEGDDVRGNAFRLHHAEQVNRRVNWDKGAVLPASFEGGVAHLQESPM